ncbi:hypothetical protein [Prochlorococcus marinus]|uniref:hypothetical protein n=1 Tax=Prochlorococcus marinus TaxID=1219 RepID=UPI0022B48ED9|nr:hypothetical protein [Prochlorococcus marinus]
MTFLRFIAIDFVFILIGLVLWFLLTNLQKKKNVLLDKGMENLLPAMPTFSELIDMEICAKKDGTGITFDSLIGNWKFINVWKQGDENMDVLSSNLLRLFSASLHLERQVNETCESKFNLCNSINFGSLYINFVGAGELKGKQPLLLFFFQRIELKLGEKTIFSRLLDIPDEKNRPFFALIKLASNGKLLTARGRGGGLAIWFKN